MKNTHQLAEAGGTAEPSILSPNSDESAPTYGGQVSAMAPRQDMYAIDTLAGGPPQDRTGDPADFTAGDKGMGLGGEALGLEPGKTQAPGYETGERIGI